MTFSHFLQPFQALAQKKGVARDLQKAQEQYTIRKVIQQVSAILPLQVEGSEKTNILTITVKTSSQSQTLHLLQLEILSTLQQKGFNFKTIRIKISQ